MKKLGKSTKKGFTLVELIVVLVILAILAAMLVPALTGYIRRAREEKEYQTAATALTAVQALVTEYYGKTAEPTTAGAKTYVTDAKVVDLIGTTVSGVTVKTVDDNYIVTAMEVEISGSVYSWDGSAWTAAKKATT